MTPVERFDALRWLTVVEREVRAAGIAHPMTRVDIGRLGTSARSVAFSLPGDSLEVVCPVASGRWSVWREIGVAHLRHDGIRSASSDTLAEALAAACADDADLYARWRSSIEDAESANANDTRPTSERMGRLD